MHLFGEGRGLGELEGVYGLSGLRCQIGIDLGYDLGLQSLPQGLVMHLFREGRGLGEFQGVQGLSGLRCQVFIGLGHDLRL